MTGLLTMLGIALASIIIMALCLAAACAMAIVYLVSEVVGLITETVFRAVRYWNRRPRVRRG